MTEESSQKRYFALDAFRGLAALMVALFHFKLNNPLTDSLLVEHAWLFVDFFFVLSGFVRAHSYFYDRAVNFGLFVRARLARLYPLYLYALLVMVAFEGLKFILHHSDYALFTNPPFSENDLEGFIFNLTLLNSFNLDPLLTWNTPGWSISAEIWTNIICAALLCLPLLRGRYMIVAGGLTVVGLIGLSALNKGLYLDFDYGWLRCLFGFGLGMMVYAAHRRLRVPLRLTAWLEIPVMIAMLYAVIYHKDYWPLQPPFVFAAVIFVFAQEQGMISRVLKYAPFQMLGAISYSVYLNHIIVAIIMAKAGMLAFPAMSEATSLAVTVAYLTVVIVYAWTTYRWVEMPARRALAPRLNRPAPLSPSLPTASG